MEGSAAPGWGRARSIRCGERRGGAESVIEGWGEVTASPGGEGGGGESGGGEGDCGLGDGAAGWAAVAREWWPEAPAATAAGMRRGDWPPPTCSPH